MWVAYRGFSVILFAPVAALVAPLFSGLFREKMAGFLKNYLPVFILGAVFGMFWICGVPGSESIVKLKAPNAMVPGMRRLGMLAWRNISAAKG